MKLLFVEVNEKLLYFVLCCVEVGKTKLREMNENMQVANMNLKKIVIYLSSCLEEQTFKEAKKKNPESGSYFHDPESSEASENECVRDPSWNLFATSHLLLNKKNH